MDNYYRVRARNKYDYHQIWVSEENDLDLDQGIYSLCAGCRLPIFSTSSVSDEAGRYLHKFCAKLPEVLIDHPLHMGAPLNLHKKYLLPDNINIICYKCNRKCEGFFYQCSDRKCRLALDILCAGIQVKILHRSHKHELVVVRSKALSTCEACESKVEGESYWCNWCDFYIHPKCASLPNAIRHEKHHHHALTLIYHPSEHSLRFRKCDSCSLCHEKLRRNAGTYICTRCDYAIHLKCVISDLSSFQPVSSRDIIGGLIHLPMANEQISVMQYVLENNKGSNNSNETMEEEKTKAIEKMHDHPLIFHNEYGEGSSQSQSESSPYLCDACIQPISPPFYSCPQCNDFYLHNCCANLALHTQHQAHFRYITAVNVIRCRDKPLSLHSRYSNVFSGMFMCYGCQRFCNGSIFKCEICRFKLDVGCVYLPEVISHNAHGKSHVLFLSYKQSPPMRSPIDCTCCHQRIQRLFYECGSCPNFKLHVRCALLPLSVKHKLDRHPLTLTTSAIPTRNVDDNFCEICEKSITTRGWSYQCKECVTLFHINCIPCVAPFSNIKFGGTIRVNCHSCPLTAIRVLTSYSYTCGLCKGTIQGRETDGIAFECIKCCYWLHSACAEKECVRE